MPYKDPDQQRRYQRRWMRQRRSEYFDDKRCSRCGGTAGLQLRYRDMAAKVSHRLWSWSAERRAAELAKCDVICKRCARGSVQSKPKRMPAKRRTSPPSTPGDPPCTGTATCSKCGETKHVLAFAADRSGIRSQCRDCEGEGERTLPPSPAWGL